MSDHQLTSRSLDAVVIGAGAAGLSAALLLGRSRRSLMVLDGGAQRNAPAAHMHGFLSRDGLAPAALLAAGRAELAEYGVRVEEGVVESVLPNGDDGFVVRLTDGATVAARSIVFATGLVDGIPDVDGLWDRWGRDVLHCPYCHGWEVRDQPLLVVGPDHGTVEGALLVRQWSADVTLLTNGNAPSEEDGRRLSAMGVGIDDRTLGAVQVVDDRLVGVRTATGSLIAGSAVFVRPTLTPNDGLLRALGCETTPDAAWVRVDRAGATSVPGVWAAGNVVNAKAQVITAAGEGSAAAIAVNQYLTERDVNERLR